MNATAVFVLDANVFIEAANRYYAFDFAPGFWREIEKLAAAGAILSIDRVQAELLRMNDNLACWARRQGNSLFAPTSDPDVIRAYRQAIQWVTAQQQYSGSAKAEFANAADGWLVAFAVAKNCCIVTHELPHATAKRRVPIPNVCQALGVAFCDTFAMLRNLGVKWS